MAFSFVLVLLCIVTVEAFTFPRNVVVKKWRDELEASGLGLDEPVQDRPVQGLVRIVQLDPRDSGFFLRRPRPPTSSMASRFPAFLSRGRPGPGPGPGPGPVSVNPLHLHLNPKSPAEGEVKKKQGIQMWQRAIKKGEKTTLPINLKDDKQTCSAVPFTQRVTAAGCETVTVHNKLCFGQCSSLFVPSEGGPPPQRGPCSRCGPSRAHTEVLTLRCGATALQKRVLLIDECKCETSRDDKSLEHS